MPKSSHYDELAARHARTDFVRVLETHSVGQALDHVRNQRPPGRIVYFYVVDEHERLKGVLPTRRLLLNAPETPVSDLMVKEMVTLPQTATLLEACEFFIMHRLLALPVVDAEGRITGVVDVELYTDEISELARREESDDVFQLIGVRLAQVQRAAIPAVFGRRFPWLLCNIVGGIACALLAGQFEDVLERVVALSLFIPVVLAVAESVSIQTLSLALQAHHGNRFRWKHTLAALSRELPIGMLLGGASGAVVATVAFLWLGAGSVALTILSAMALAITTAALLGLAIPTLLHAARRDPRLASGPIVLTLTDLCTLSYYLGLAHWIV
ncbi:MAG: magnesium transporter [Planctomycetes bacterium]|nr:magnesium transporter [Planctomycetota bacterium]